MSRADGNIVCVPFLNLNFNLQVRFWAESNLKCLGSGDCSPISKATHVPRKGLLQTQMVSGA